MFRRLATILALLAFCGAAHAGSTVNPNAPSSRSDLNSAVVRNNFLAAYNDITKILGKYAATVPPPSPVNLQDWVDTSASPNYKFKVWNAQTNAWVQTATLNVVTGAYSVTASSGAFAATSPITVGFSGGVATYGINLNANFAVSGGALALATSPNARMIANCSGASAEPGQCAWGTFADQAIGNTNGMIPSRVGGAWSTVSTGSSGHTLPFLDVANTWSAAQTVYPGSSSIQNALTFTLHRISNVDGSPSRYEATSYGANSTITVARVSGTAAAPTTLVSSDLIGGLEAFGYNGSSIVGPAAAVRAYSLGTWSGTNQPAMIDFATTANGDATKTLTTRARIYDNGAVTIGSASVTPQSAGTLNIVGDIFNNGVAPTGTAGYVRATSPTIASPVLSGTITGTYTLGGTPSVPASGITGILPVLSGGTGAATITGMMDTAFGSTQGTILFRNATVWTALAPGIAGQALLTGGAGANPSWTAIPGTGTVTSAAYAASTGMSVTGTTPCTTTCTWTFAVDKATVANYYAATANKVITTDIVYPPEVTITYGATTTFDFGTFINGIVTLTGNITTQTFSGVIAGKSGSIRFQQSGAGSFTTVWNSILKWPGGVAPSLTTGSATAIDILTYNCVTATYCQAALAKDVR